MINFFYKIWIALEDFDLESASKEKFSASLPLNLKDQNFSGTAKQDKIYIYPDQFI